MWREESELTANFTNLANEGDCMRDVSVIWTDYMKYRIQLRGFDPEIVEQIVLYSSERYVDTVTGRCIVVGSHNKLLVLIPYERGKNCITPVTIHVTSRQQVNLRVKSERLKI